MNTIFREVATAQFSLTTAAHPDLPLLHVEKLATDRQAFITRLAEHLNLDTMVDNEPPAANPQKYRTVDPEAWRSSLPSSVLNDFVRRYGALTTALGYDADLHPTDPVG